MGPGGSVILVLICAYPGLYKIKPKTMALQYFDQVLKFDATFFKKSGSLCML